jgi:hypothetical protein
MADERVEIEFLGKDKVTNVLKKIQNKVTNTASRVKKSWQQSSLAVKAAWAAVGFVIVRTFQDIIAKTMEAELAQARMVQQFENVGIAAEQNIKAINQLANELQRKTVFSNDEIVSAAALAASYQLNAKQIEELLPALADLTAFTRKSTGQMSQFEDSVKLMGFVLEGQVGRLKLLGITMTETQKEILATGTATERLAVFLEAVQSNAGGLAEAMGETASGSVIQFRNEIDDLKKEIGGELLPAFAGFLKGISKFIKFFKVGLETIGASIAKVIIRLQAMKRAFTEGFTETREWIESETNRIDELLKENVKDIWGFSQESSEALGNIDDAIQETSKNYASLVQDVRELDKARKDALIAEGAQSALYKTLNKEYLEASANLDAYNKVLNDHVTSANEANSVDKKSVDLTQNQAMMLATRLERERELMKQFQETGGETGLKSTPQDIDDVTEALRQLEVGGEITSKTIREKVGLMKQPFATVKLEIQKTTSALKDTKDAYDEYIVKLVSTEAVELEQYRSRLELLQQMAAEWRQIRDLKQDIVNIEQEEEPEEEPDEDTNE